MGVYFNPGNELYKRAVDSEIYVDKTGLISVTNRYNVIRINIRDCISESDGIEDMPGYLSVDIKNEMSEEFPELSLEDTRSLVKAIEKLCRQYDMLYEDAKRWYDGYNVKGIDIYNPRSVVMSMTGHDYDSYWTKTETYEALKVYIEMNFDGLRDTIVYLMAGGEVSVDTGSFVNDMVSFATRDDVLTLLIHLGYLTYDFDSGTVRIPNQEIMGEYATSLKVLGWSEVAEALKSSDALLKATLSGDWQLVENKKCRHACNDCRIKG